MELESNYSITCEIGFWSKYSEMKSSNSWKNNKHMDKI